MSRRPLCVLAGYIPEMAEEWRVSLIFDDRSGQGKRRAVRDLLRRRLGDGIAVSGEKTRIFLYAGSASAAEEAEYAARDVLAQESLSADFRFECWDPVGEAWRDARTEPRDPAAGPPADDDGERGRQRRGNLIDNLILPYLEHFPPV
jgi:hypothetical protein